MTAIVLPDIDRSTLEDLKSKMPSLNFSEIELPRIEKVGREADKALDRLLGREKSSAWPWVAAGIGLVTLIGIGAALLSWNRRTSSGWSDGNTGLGSPMGSGTGSSYGAASDLGTDASVADVYGDTTTSSISSDIGTSSLGGTTAGSYGLSTDTTDGDYGTSGSGLTAAESSLTTSSLEGNQP